MGNELVANAMRRDRFNSILHHRVSGDYQNVFGKAVAPFLTMLTELPDTKKSLRYSLYFDNHFTSLYLLSNLKALGYGVTGTIRDNRVPKNCPLPSKVIMKKKTRVEYVHTLDKRNGILLVRWVDNNIVSMVSTTYGISPLEEVKRYSQAQKKNIQIPRPPATGKYNSSLGGTELMDKNISRYRIVIGCKKWWRNLFTWLVDAAI
ncbi:hypothetical protein NQ314_003050 [Rhamnusium bicolor]|uniref:PiggyBac transposable element-derived protein domain-containing protein n=1 Tax=Rhamnusium bicolor TaxID=1586634 RepID=A0AAV8ZPA6_9CUCU|nr:hypothetical protein NQ314_003050 [Rhamnusium bicolor]